jgi:hypothetical protein
MKLSQQQMELAARLHANEKYFVFWEIMSGPNPLTADDLEKLIARWPERWGVFEPWVEKLREEEKRGER